MERKSLKIEVVKATKSIYRKGLVKIGEGNVSIRVPDKEELFITPTFNDYENLTEKDIAHISFDGTQLSKGKIASSEYRLHVAIYKARPRAKAIIHTHSSHATIFSVIRKKIPILMEEMIILLGGEINVSTFEIAHSESIGVKALKALGETNAILLANHGALACGRNIKHALIMAELIEKMAMIYWGAIQVGRPMGIPKEVLVKFKEDFNLNFNTS